MKQYRIRTKSYVNDDVIPECHLAEDDPAQELIDNDAAELNSAFIVEEIITDEDQ